MKSLSLSTLAELAGAEIMSGNGERVASGVGIDSRTIRPGELFVAIRGAKQDGHEHVKEAAEKGAIAALVEKLGSGKIPTGFTYLRVADTQMALQKLAHGYRRLLAVRVKLEKHGEGWLLDDSYNANPDSLLAGLQTLEELPGKGRNVALLGAMAELGSFGELLHEESGGAVARRKIGLCLVVGEDGKYLVEGAKKIRPGDWIRWFPKKEELAQAGDRILVKGSRREGMEVVAEQLRGKK